MSIIVRGSFKKVKRVIECSYVFLTTTSRLEAGAPSTIEVVGTRNALPTSRLARDALEHRGRQITLLRL